MYLEADQWEATMGINDRYACVRDYVRTWSLRMHIMGCGGIWGPLPAFNASSPRHHDHPKEVAERGAVEGVFR